MGLLGSTAAPAQEGPKRDVLASVIAPDARTGMTEDLLGPMAIRSTRDGVPRRGVPGVGPCDVPGQLLSVAGGRVSGVVVAEPLGDHAADLTPEQARESWDTIASPDDLIVPDDTTVQMGQPLTTATQAGASGGRRRPDSTLEDPWTPSCCSSPSR